MNIALIIIVETGSNTLMLQCTIQNALAKLQWRCLRGRAADPFNNPQLLTPILIPDMQTPRC